MGVEEDLSAANRRYYDAFERADLDAMSGIWEHSPRSTCTHPGWATLRGWSAIGASWFALFENGRTEQFVLTREQTTVIGEVGWVSVDENMLSEDGVVAVAALNVFVNSGTQWRMVCHHGSVVQDVVA